MRRCRGSRLLFFLKAYPFGKQISLLMLFLFEAIGLDGRKWRFLFDPSLIESRAILGFVYDSGGLVEARETHMHIEIPYKKTRLVLNLRWNSSDFLVFEQVFIKEEYAPLFDKSLLSPTIVDAGANIGCTTAYLKALYPGASILSIEPDPANFKALEENMVLCGFDGITCMQAAIWNDNGTVQLGRNFGDGRDWSARIQTKGSTLVSAATLFSVLKENSIERADILKMDIEGAELSVFEKDLSLASVIRSLKLIAIEVHDDKEKNIERSLMGAGFSLFKQGETLFGKKSANFD